jgi:hypothetical protein
MDFKTGDKVVFKPPKDISLENMIDQLIELNPDRTREECKEMIYKLWATSKG